MRRVIIGFLLLVLLISMGSRALADNLYLQDSAASITLVWPQDCTAINYDDFHSIADYLLILAWYHVDGAKGYILSLFFDKGGGDLARWDGVVSLQYLVMYEGLALLPFMLDETTWNALAPYVISWQVRALSNINDLTSVMAVSPKYAFTMNPAIK